MFQGLLKPKSYTKCKNCLKLIKTRLETIRKKRNAVQKFLKKDLVDLLRNSLEYNAYGRAEGFLVEQNMSACYELIAKFAGCISSHVRELSKQDNCPDECKEAIPSLIYAAARFSDLPELRDLRTLFQQKFGDSLDPYTSKEFIERLRQTPPTKEMKIQLLHELAQEHSIEWDRKALEQKLYLPPPVLHEEKEKPNHDPQNDHGEVKFPKKINDNVKPKPDDFQWRVRRSNENETASTNSSYLDSKKSRSSSFENVFEEEETETKKPFSNKHVPPPYVKEVKGESNLKKTVEALPAEKPKPRSVRRRPLKPPPVENTVKDFSETGGALDEEMILDGLLMRYVEKQTPNEPGIGKERVKDQNRRYAKSSSPVAKTWRRKSLPQRETSRMDTLQVYDRATSLVPEMMRTRTTGHVHPSLPDYEDLSDRLASLRRT